MDENRTMPPETPRQGDFVFLRRGRTAKVALILATVYSALAAARFLLDAAPWILALLALPTLPALWEFCLDRTSEIRLSRDRIDWRTGGAAGSVALADIDRVRLDIRWDLSPRATVLLRDGARQRIPDATLPPERALRQALTARGIAVERHPFAAF